ncbi:MAG: hypothetical protein JOZ16_01275 [Methylobacteriaceae bacterium]|nr:hypothetical protein [Methylobacteriaceae bacterium]
MKRYKPAEGPRELTPKHRLIIEYMVFGVDNPHVLRDLTRESRTIDPETGVTISTPVPVQPGVPLTLEEVATVLHLKRRYIRQLLALPIMSNALAVEVQRLRSGEHARSIHTLIGVRDDPGLGKAADRKVRLSAAQAILGEGDGRGAKVSVTVNTQHVTPGYVLDLRPADVIEREEQAKLIDARPERQASDD